MVGSELDGENRTLLCPEGVKVRAKDYMENVLEPIVKPLGSTLFNGGHWTFQQDSAPAHGAKVVQNWLRTEIPDFIAKEEWPSASPDLNPLDYDLWSKLETMACSKPHTSVEALKSSLIKAWREFPMETERASIDKRIPRLRSCVKAKGGNFEE